jgi:GNAT superfamily N-acetyltransferase
MSGDQAISLRTVAVGDRLFLERVYAESRADELSATSWTNAEKEIFCRDQFAAQDQYYLLHYPQCERLVILHAGQPVGRLYLDRRPAEVRIVDIALLTAERGKGLGGRLMRTILAEAQKTGLPVKIHVERTNPARRLYDRLGFKLVTEGEIYDLLESSPG